MKSFVMFVERTMMRRKAGSREQRKLEKEATVSERKRRRETLVGDTK